jgi:hypothetical protein
MRHDPCPVGLPLYRSSGFRDFAEIIVAEQDKDVKVRREEPCREFNCLADDYSSMRKLWPMVFGSTSSTEVV